jgi:hypothetical protein
MFKNMSDWIIINTINTQPFLEIVKKTIEDMSPISLEQKSTRGENVKQYDLFDRLKSHIMINEIKETISLNLKKHLGYKINSLKLVSAWTVLGYKNTYHTLHKHNIKTNHVSSVIYLKVPKSNEFNFYYIHQQNEEIFHRRLNPKEGNIFIFPCWLWHGVYPQSEEGLRQTLNLDFEYKL